MNKINSEKNIVKTILRECLGCKAGESLLIVTDDKLCKLAEIFYKHAQGLNRDAVLMKIPTRGMHGEEPPDLVAEALKSADVAILLTSMSLSHTKARKNATSKHGTRAASLPGATLKMLKRAIPVNYRALRNKVAKTAQALTRAQAVEIRTKAGTHLVMSLKGRKGFSDDGIYVKKGSFGNLPAGEACTGPREGTTNGILVIDGSAPFLGKVKRPMRIKIENGYASSIDIPEISLLVKKFGKRILNVAELGIGYNPKAKITGNILEDEKAKSTAHIAFGNNKSFGGRVSCPSHLDFVFLNPDIRLDGKRI